MLSYWPNRKFIIFSLNDIDCSHTCLNHHTLELHKYSFLFYWNMFWYVSVLRECKNVELTFSDVACKSDLLKGSKKGTIYLTPYRVRACHNQMWKASIILCTHHCNSAFSPPSSIGVAGVCEQQHQGLPGFSYVSLLFDERLQHWAACLCSQLH